MLLAEMHFPFSWPIAMNAPTELRDQTFTVDEALEVARHHYRANDLARARRVCDAVLAAVPDHLGTLELLCELCAAQSMADQALPAIEAGIAQRPNLAALHLLRGKILQRLARNADAIESFERAFELGAGADALRSATDLYLLLGDQVAALDAFERALEVEPGAPDLLSNRGSLLKRMGRLEEALLSHRHAVAASPKSADLLNNLANTLQTMGRHAEALEAFDAILAIEPNTAAARRGRAVSQMRLGQPILAAESFGWLVHRGYRDASVLAAWSLCLADAGRFREATQAVEHALAAAPGNPELLAQQGMLMLLQGRFSEGFPLFEHRFGSDHFSARDRDRFPDSKRWTGESSPSGRTMLLHAEQGFGDTIQFCRYARALAELGADVCLEVDASMVLLMKSLSPAIRVVCRGEALPTFDLHCPLMSLPGAWLKLKGEMDFGSQAAAYLQAEPERIARWRVRCSAASAQLMIGLVWRGRATHRRASQRDVPLAELLAALPAGPRYVSLQRALTAEEQALIATRLDIEPIGDELSDFSDAAAACVLMDRIVSVDTSLAHLAGALGRPVNVLLPFAPDWRWQLTGATSPWYPTMTLCRQTVWGSWKSALSQLEGLLAPA